MQSGPVSDDGQCHSTSPLEGEVAERSEAGGGYPKNDSFQNHPPPHPSPSRGEGADRVRGTAAVSQSIS